MITYLAVGDSYTIGEGVPLVHSFPYQTVQILRKKGSLIAAPEIVATTGWTTDELMEGLQQQSLLSTYTFVSLLIGVNNQYRGRSIEEYAVQFEQLLLLSIQKVNNYFDKVFVLSIPDWSVTPFAKQHLPDAKGRTIEMVSKEIDAFNNINKQISKRYKVQYIDITMDTRKAYNDLSLLTNDGLHPCAKAYTQWALSLATSMANTNSIT